MTDATTRPAMNSTPDTPPPAPLPVPVTANSPLNTDAQTLRYVARAEQQRLSADAKIERRARAAQLNMELREQQRAAARRKREANVADKRARAQRRRIQRAERRNRLRIAALSWADRALFVLPILFPMAVAWAGQIRFAMTVMGWPLAAAIVFAAGFELSTAYVARLDWLSRAAGDRSLLFRAATWSFAAGAAVMNYWHAADPGFAPTGEAVSYGLMSLTGVVLWELMSAYRHRTTLRAQGRLPATRPRFGLARWIWFGTLTRLAWLLALRDGYTTTDSAWRAAINAIDQYGTAKSARKAVRGGRPVPPRAQRVTDERDGACAAGHRDDTHPANGQRDTGHQEVSRDIEPRTAYRDTPSRHSDRDGPVQQPDRNCPPQSPDRDGPKRDDQLDGHRHEHRDAPGRAHADSPSPVPTPSRPVSDQPVHGGDTSHASHNPEGVEQNTGEPAMSARMLAYARNRLAEGISVTGADLDRRFGTRDYGRRILRRLAAQTEVADPRPDTSATVTATRPPTPGRNGRTNKRRHRHAADDSAGEQPWTPTQQPIRPNPNPTPRSGRSTPYATSAPPPT